MHPSATDILNAYEAGLNAPAQYGRTCPDCGRLLQESVTGCRPSEHGFLCSDCYYESLGKLIEEHPITSPRGRR